MKPNSPRLLRNIRQLIADYESRNISTFFYKPDKQIYVFYTSQPMIDVKR